LVKDEPDSQFREKYISNKLIRKRGSPNCKLSGTTDWGLPHLIHLLFALCSQIYLLNPYRKKFKGILGVSVREMMRILGMSVRGIMVMLGVSVREMMSILGMNVRGIMVM
jgi:hypothetical protein